METKGKGLTLALVMGGFLLLQSGSPSRAWDCTGTSVGFLPLGELGTGMYQGAQGGFYPGGSNTRPAEHDAALDRTGRMMLLDAAGQPDAAGGRIVLMSIGMSNTTQEFSTFKPLADSDPQKNARVVIVDAAQGGQDAATISNPNAAYWTNVDQKLAAAGVSPAQVQAVWLKEARARPTETFPDDAVILRDQLRAIVQILKSRYPNTRAVYLDGRTYGGYASTTLNPEPYAYQSGFAVKWVIEEQLAGGPALNFDPARGPVAAPWLSWGAYLWADGLTPRADGLTWACADFVESDGTHPSVSGRQKVANLLLDFFKSDPTTVPWFLDCYPADPGTFAAPPEARGITLLAAGPGTTEIAWESLDPVAGAGTGYDLVAGLIGQLRADGGFDRAICAAAGIADTPYLDARPDPALGQAIYYLLRGRNACGWGTYGDGSPDPDPRDLLDAGTPSCL
jgi:hypothetical protein